MPPSSLCPTSAQADLVHSVLYVKHLLGFVFMSNGWRWIQQEAPEAVHHHQVEGPVVRGGARAVPRRTSAIRSHAQKYFMKVQKNGLMAHVPPPRPMRIQKSSDDDMLALQASTVCPSPSNCFISVRSSWDDKLMLIDYSSNNESMPSDHSGVLSGVEGDIGSGIVNMYSKKFSWSGSSSKSTFIYDVPEQGSQQSLYPVTPNFAEVYSLIATFIDPEIANSFGTVMKKLKEMDPVTAKTALVLVKNLASNLSSPDFEPLRRWLLKCVAKNKEAEEMNNAAAATANQIYIMPSQCNGFLPGP